MPPFGARKTVFYNAKGGLPQCERPPFVNMEIFSVAHVRHELDAHQPDFLLRVVAAKIVHGGLKVVGVALLKLFADVVHTVVVPHFLDEIAAYDLSSAVYYALNLGQNRFTYTSRLSV